MAKQWGCRHNTARVPSPWGEPTVREGDDGAGWRIAQCLGRDEPQSESPQQPQGRSAHARQGRAGRCRQRGDIPMFSRWGGEGCSLLGGRGDRITAALGCWGWGQCLSIPTAPPAPFPRPTGGTTLAWVPSPPSGNL